jgi:hypothetical protein
MDVVNKICGTVITVAVVAAIVVLAWHGSITGEAATGILGGIVGGGVVGAAQYAGNKQGALVASAAHAQHLAAAKQKGD